MILDVLDIQILQKPANYSSVFVQCVLTISRCILSISDDFELGFANMVRISAGKRCMSASEKEEKGEGQRTKQKRLLYEEYDQDIDGSVESSSSCDQSQVHSYEATVPKKKRAKISIPPFLSLTSPAMSQEPIYKP